MATKQTPKRQRSMLLLSVALCFVAIGVTLLGVGIALQLQATTPPGTFVFDDSGSTVTIQGLRPAFQNIGTINLPSEINGKPVTKIDDFAFNGSFMLTRVAIPSSITTIGERAFANTGLSNVTLLESVTTIGANAFAGGNMTIFVERIDRPVGWDETWNGEHTVIWGSATKTTLGELIGIFTALELEGNNDRWTSQSWERFTGKLSDARDVFNDAFATPEQIDQAYNDLFVARWDSTLGLQLSPNANRGPLTSLITIAEKLVSDWKVENYYAILWEPDSWKALTDALAEAKIINGYGINDARATQTAVDQKFSDLNSARRNLVPIPNFELPPEEASRDEMLVLLINFVLSLNRGDYTDMIKWYDLRDARFAAEAVSKNPNPTSAAVSGAFYNLLDAYRELIEQSPPNNRGPVSPFIWIGAALVIAASVVVAIVVDLNTGRRPIIQRNW